MDGVKGRDKRDESGYIECSQNERMHWVYVYELSVAYTVL